MSAIQLKLRLAKGASVVSLSSGGYDVAHNSGMCDNYSLLADLDFEVVLISKEDKIKLRTKIKIKNYPSLSADLDFEVVLISKEDKIEDKNLDKKLSLNGQFRFIGPHQEKIIMVLVTNWLVKLHQRDDGK